VDTTTLIQISGLENPQVVGVKVAEGHCVAQTIAPVKVESLKLGAFATLGLGIGLHAYMVQLFTYYKSSQFFALLLFFSFLFASQASRQLVNKFLFHVFQLGSILLKRLIELQEWI
jgi:hypothetical protein